MTDRQRSYFFRDLWAPVCQRRGWDPNDRPTRQEFFCAVLGLDEPKSFNDLTESEFDRLKARCLAEIRPGDLNAQLRSQDQHRQRLLREIGILKLCLGLYRKYPGAYVQAILQDRFAGQNPEDMNERDLRHLLSTLAGCVNGARGLRAKAGHSLHDMHTAAQTGACPCKQCRTPQS